MSKALKWLIGAAVGRRRARVPAGVHQGRLTEARPPPSAPPPVRMLARGITKRCALCGQGGLFRGWFRMRDRCPRCGYRFEREEGFFLGAIVVNLAITEGLLLVMGVIPCIVLLATNPDASLWPVVMGGAFAAVLAPVIFYPFSRTIWVAFELMLRPNSSAEPPDQR